MEIKLERSAGAERPKPLVEALAAYRSALKVESEGHNKPTLQPTLPDQTIKAIQRLFPKSLH
jgi:hypothetical protein